MSDDASSNRAWSGQWFHRIPSDGDALNLGHVGVAIQLKEESETLARHALARRVCGDHGRIWKVWAMCRL